MLLGSPERKAFGGLALPLYEDLGDLSGQASALMNLGVEAYYEGDWVKAARPLRARRVGCGNRIGDAVSAAMATNNIAEILLDQGHLEEARRLFIAAAEQLDAQANGGWQPRRGRTFVR